MTNLIRGIVWLIICFVGIGYGWLPHHWALVMILIGCIEIDNWMRNRFPNNEDEDT